MCSADWIRPTVAAASSRQGFFTFPPIIFHHLLAEFSVSNPAFPQLASQRARLFTDKVRCDNNEKPFGAKKWRFSSRQWELFYTGKRNAPPCSVHALYIKSRMCSFIIVDCWFVGHQVFWLFFCFCFFFPQQSHYNCCTKRCICDPSSSRIQYRQ